MCEPVGHVGQADTATALGQTQEDPVQVVMMSQKGLRQRPSR